jgi:hypothetical protein
MNCPHAFKVIMHDGELAWGDCKFCGLDRESLIELAGQD